MFNQVMLVGRLVDKPRKEENKVSITLAIPRSYKNKDGFFESDYVDCVMWDGLSKNVEEFLQKGDLIGLKGKIETREENNIKITEIIAEKVTFLSSKKEEEE